jgi:hypothetical protein
MKRSDALEYVSFVVDDALCGRPLDDDIHAVVREAGEPTFGPEDQEGPTYKYSSVLVGWQCGFEPLFVAVHSYLDVELDDEEVEELAKDYLEEREWFTDGPKEADYIIR